MSELGGRVAVVTGAGGGIGRAVSLRLAAEGATVYLVGRGAARLSAVAESATGMGGRCLACPADLTVDTDVDRVKARMESECGAVDILVHSAGTHSLGRIEEMPPEELDLLYRVNVRACYTVTRAFLPMLKARQGQIVFMNSSVGLAARESVGQYAATKHALKAIADSLRHEVNADGVRVLSVFLGRTATPMQETLHRLEGRSYVPDDLMQAEDVAALVTSALSLPRSAEVTEIRMRPMKRPR